MRDGGLVFKFASNLMGGDQRFVGVVSVENLNSHCQYKKPGDEKPNGPDSFAKCRATIEFFRVWDLQLICLLV